MCRSLKFTLCKTREQIGFFVSFFQLSVRQDKDKWQNRCEIYNLCISGGGGKVFGQFEVRKQFLPNMKNNVHTTHTTFFYPDPLYFNPPPPLPLMCKYMVAQIFSKVTKKLIKKPVCSRVLQIVNLNQWQIIQKCQNFSWRESQIPHIIWKHSEIKGEKKNKCHKYWIFHGERAEFPSII